MLAVAGFEYSFLVVGGGGGGDDNPF